MALRGSSSAAMTSGQSQAIPRSTAGCSDGRISARNCSGVGAANSRILIRLSVRDELICVPLATTGIDPFRAECLDVRLEALFKLLLVARTLRPPRNLRQGEKAREGHELQIPLRRDELGPDAGLDAENMRVLFRSEASWDRLPGEHLGNRLWAALVSFPRRTGFAFTLVIVEVELVCGRDDDVVTALRSGLEYVGPVPSPPLDNHPLWRLSFHLLVPCHGPLAEAFDDADNLASEIGLYFLVRRQPLLRHEPVYVGHALPHLVANFVAGEIDVRRREQPADLRKDTADEVVRLRVRRIECASVMVEKLRVGSSGSSSMAGHLDLGHDHDVALGRISDDLAHVSRRQVLGLPVNQRADLGQLWVSGDFQPPSFIVGQMELEHVELVRGHLVDDLEQRLLAEEMTAEIDQQSTPAEARRVLDVHARRGAGIRSAGEDLPKRLDTVE